MKRGVRRVHHTDSKIASGLILQVIDLRLTTTGNLPFRLGSRLKTSNKPGEVVARPQRSPRSLPRGSSLINDNHCVNSVTGQKNSVHVTGQGDLNPAPVVSKNNKMTLNFNVDSHVANAHIVTGLPQRKGVNPTFCQMYTEIKYVKNVSCVGHLSSVNLVTNVPHAVIDPPVGARLHQFGEIWEALGSSPKVVTTLREGYTLPFRFRPNLTRSPTVISSYHNPSKQSFLVEALHQLINKNAVEPVENQNSLGFYNRLFLVPKPNNRWRPILDLSILNTFLNTESFKMETPETIRTSLQAGEWVTSIDFKDAYFHIPIHSQSRKYMRFHLQGRSYQFKALPFGLSTAPMEFTVVAKEVKLVALQKGIRTHQYLDDWLVRASTHDTCLQQTQILVTLLGPGPIRLPTGSHLGQSGGEAPGLPLQQNNSDCSRVAQHALVLGPGSNVKPDPTVPAQHTQSSVSAIQPGPSQEPGESEPTCLAPRASAIKEQGFSEAVAARIEAPQRRSTRSVYEADHFYKVVPQ